MKLAEKEPRVRLIRLKNILFATDFSPSSGAALPYVLAIARQYESTVYLAHVVTPAPYAFVTPDLVESTLEQTTGDAELRLSNLSKQFEGVAHEPILGRGEVIEALSTMIKKHDIDLVVVGTHGRRGIRRLLLGSVAEELFRNSPCPVLTVGSQASSSTPKEMVLHHILYPTALLGKESDGLRYAISLASEYAAHLTVLHALEVLREARTTDPRARLVVTEIEKQMRRLIPAEAELQCDAEFKVEFGNPAETILRTSRRDGVDLIVLGVRQADPLAAHLTGNIAYRVVTEADCPVLTVRANL